MYKLLLAGAIVGGFLSVPASASFFSIPQPNSPVTNCANQAYLSCTGVLPVPVPDGTDFSNFSAFGVTVSLSSPLMAATVPTSWATWACPPFTETCTPRVGESSTDAETLSLSLPVPVFGFELEPESFNSELFQVNFYNGGTGGTLLGQIFLTVTGDSGARLFAAEVTGATQRIDTVTISTPTDDTFAIANVSVLTPEPMTFSLMGGGLLGLGLLGRRRRRAKK